MTDSLRFNWQAEPEGFLKWLIPELLANMLTKRIDELTQVTNGFQDVVLTVQINGVEVPTKHFIESLMKNYEYATRDAAKEQIGEVFDITKITDLINDLECAIREGSYELCRKLGVPFNPSEDD